MAWYVVGKLSQWRHGGRLVDAVSAPALYNMYMYNIFIIYLSFVQAKIYGNDNGNIVSS